MGLHKYDVLAAKIKSVHEFFRFSGKISATATDNRSNFVTSRSLYRSSFSKCVALWNKASCSTVVSDQLQERLKKKASGLFSYSLELIL